MGISNLNTLLNILIDSETHVAENNAKYLQTKTRDKQLKSSDLDHAETLDHLKIFLS